METERCEEHHQAARRPFTFGSPFKLQRIATKFSIIDATSWCCFGLDNKFVRNKHMWMTMLMVGLVVTLGALLNEGNCEELLIGYLTGSKRRQGDDVYSRPGLSISGALTLAVEEVNSLHPIRDNHTLGFVVAETFGDETESIYQTAYLWTQNVSAYIGPQETCVHEARLAASFNLPMISYYCARHESSDKQMFPTFSRTRPPDTQVSKSVVSVLLTFNWKKITFLYSNANKSDYEGVAKTILKTLDDFDIEVLFKKTWDIDYFHGFIDNPFRAIVEDTYLQSRIYVILGHYYEHVGLLVYMQEKGLFDDGNYFVVGVDIEQYDQENPEKYLRGLLKEDTEDIAKEAYRSYLGIVGSPPIDIDHFDNFTVKVNAYMESPPFSFPNPLTKVGGLKRIRPEAAYLYDAVRIYASALNDTLAHGESPRDGRNMFKYIKGRTYKSVMGYAVYMDENGDPEGNYTLIARQQNPDLPSEYGLYPVGLFQRNENVSRSLVLRLTASIDWVSGQIPIDEPFCGFKGEKCVTHTSEIAAGVPGGVLLVIAIVALVVYRNWKYEQELDSLLWKIDYKEIQINEETPNVGGSVNGKSVRTLHPLIRTSQVSLNSNPDSDFRYSTIYTQIGTHKGRIFAVKKVKKRHVDITRKMKKELKMIRDLRHDNLNAFIGACVGPPNVCIITEYCTRGSLKDILDNEDVKLDNMFIASLVLDIVRGMIYLHDSAIKSHGNLKSSNCLVDSRWVLKIAEFGLHDLKAEPESEDEEERKRKLEGLLYRAPELLRDPYAPHCGTQKGDVYSFAIILYETHGRHGPFGEIDMTPAEILKRIVKHDDNCPPFRPQLELLENLFDAVRDCLKECWKECAEERPDFKSIRHKLRPMRKGMKPNIFDNMIAMMEKYANNLEALVDEKTDQLIEEKKKTEALLYEMLPRYVAEQLKRGNKVEAESFDRVTIYFSDIVGFTWMSAESSPLQIVDFLNDLYTCFDSIIENYDVYKVETIGDAYMVVSGLPIRNGDQHAAEIASMSLHLLQAIRMFKIRHRPDDALMLRIGIHSGPVCAGVVGLKMPRYCLFGDTVNTASRMESNGLPLKVHCSEECKRTLDKLGGYYLEERGLIKIKGKGEMRTYWLIGEDQKRRWQTMQKRTRRQSSSLRNNPACYSNGCVKVNGPRSSLKKGFKSLVSRTVSLDSSKKLRFAGGTDSDVLQEGFQFSTYCCDEPRLSPDQGAQHSANDRRTSLPKGRSCPCIQHGSSSPDPDAAQSQFLYLGFPSELGRGYGYGAPPPSSPAMLSYDASALELDRTIPLLSRESSPETGDELTAHLHQGSARRQSSVSSESAPLLRAKCTFDCVCCEHHGETPV